LLSEGMVVAQGEMSSVLTSINLSTAYKIDVEVIEEGGRFFARSIER
jgi:ABC-type cobalamin/Fe3+-siderophores transport system ATPase subunit